MIGLIPVRRQNAGASGLMRRNQVAACTRDLGQMGWYEAEHGGSQPISPG